MFNNVKALIVVATLGYVVFFFSKAMCLRHMAADDFARRRNAWFALTAVAFLSPGFWIYGVFAMAYLAWATHKDSNPLALYTVVTFIVPNASFFIPTVLVNQLFDLTQYRILSLVVLVPTMLRIWRRSPGWTDGRLRLGDYALMGYLLIQCVTLIPYESATNTARRSLLLGLDTMILFYVFSRLKGEKQIAEVMTGFWLSAAVMALIAIFERARGWLLYTGLVDQWGAPNDFAWLMRGEALRAQAAANHSINLGYTVAVALGFFLFLQDRRKKFFNWICMALMLAAVYASGSRGAWMMAAMSMVFFAVWRPHAGRRLFWAAFIGACAIGLMYLTPLKESIVDKLPFIGTSDQDTVDYRQQLFTLTWPLILQHPFFGDPFVYNQLEALKQGQGIIDIVNGYIAAALSTGFTGLALLITLLALALFSGILALWRTRALDPDKGTLGAGLVSVFMATIIFVATAGFGPTAYILAALLVSYAGVDKLFGFGAQHRFRWPPPRESALKSSIIHAHAQVLGQRR